MKYKVKTDIFEGPFDLLVYLIENARMSIYDIQISTITHQYLEYVEKMKAPDVQSAAEFMVLAAMLIEIKAKLLLPRPEKIGTLDGDEDPRAELVLKLLEYKKFKGAAEELRLIEDHAQTVFEKPCEDLTAFTREQDEYLNLDIKRFAAAFKLFLNKKRKIVEITGSYSRVKQEKKGVEFKIRSILNFFKRGKAKEANFEEFLEEGGKYEKVITFISILEMVRRRKVEVAQQKTFGKLKIWLIPKQGDNQGEGQR